VTHRTFCPLLPASRASQKRRCKSRLSINSYSYVDVVDCVGIQSKNGRNKISLTLYLPRVICVFNLSVETTMSTRLIIPISSRIRFQAFQSLGAGTLTFVYIDVYAHFSRNTVLIINLHDLLYAESHIGYWLLICFMFRWNQSLTLIYLIFSNHFRTESTSIFIISEQVIHHIHQP